MKIVAISDTHGQHHALNLPEGDVLIHAGDLSGRGYVSEIENFLDWFSQLKFKHKIFIAGNHDFFFEKAEPSLIAEMIPPDIHYLNDSGVTIEGLSFWGSPVTPWFYDWAFNRDRGEQIQEHWKLIPDETDVLITHGPPYGILDETACSEKAGCRDLGERVQQLKPQFHIFGHIHEGAGQFKDGTVTYVNASVLDDRYDLVHSPTVLLL